MIIDNSKQAVLRFSDLTQPLVINVARDNDGLHLVHIFDENNTIGLRLTPNQAARLAVRLMDLFGGAK